MLEAPDRLLLQFNIIRLHQQRHSVYSSEMYLRNVEPRPDPVLAEVVALTGNALVGYKEAMPEVVCNWEVDSKSS